MNPSPARPQGDSGDYDVIIIGQGIWADLHASLLAQLAGATRRFDRAALRQVLHPASSAGAATTGTSAFTTSARCRRVGRRGGSWIWSLAGRSVATDVGSL